MAEGSPAPPSPCASAALVFVVLGVVVAAIGFLFFPFSLAPALLLEIVGALLGGIAWEQPLGRHAAVWGVLACAVTLFLGVFFVYTLLSGKPLLI